MENNTKENVNNASPKKEKESSKTWEKVINIVSLVIIVLAIIVAINGLIAKKRGYNNFFGKATYAVESDSMAGSNKDSFKRGDIILVNILNDSQKQNIKVATKQLDADGNEVKQENLIGEMVPMYEGGDIITYWATGSNGKYLNSHRVIAVNKDENGKIVTILVRGDNPQTMSGPGTELVQLSDVIGTYSGKIGGVGHVVIFAQSQWGMFTLVVIPSVLVLGYAVYEFVISYKGFSKEKKVADREALKEELRREMEKEENEGTTSTDSLPKEENNSDKKDNE